MKVLLCDLLLLSLFSSVFSSCQRDCLTCQEKLHPALDSFDLEVGPQGKAERLSSSLTISSLPTPEQTLSEKPRPLPQLTGLAQHYMAHRKQIRQELLF